MRLKELEWITGMWAFASLVFAFLGLYILMGFSLLLLIIGIVLVNKQLKKEEEALEKIDFCKKCNKETKHIKCGFGIPGGFSGNARWRCTSCKTERV